MKFFMSFLVWIIIAAVLGTGIWLLTAKGDPWVLAISAAAFVIAVGKIGCATH